MKFYKLTNQKMQTHGSCQWVIGEQKTVKAAGDLCGSGWLRAYEDPLVAVFMNPIRADFKSL